MTPLRLAGFARFPRPSWQSLALLALTCALAWCYLWAHAHRPILANDLPAHAWFGWADQGEYFRAATAWAGWNFDASQHHYPAGYALMAAPFVRLFPSEPFIAVDLLCWVASLWVFAALAAQLAPRLAAARAAGGLVFFLVTVTNNQVFYTWLTPWTSTPATLCIYTALLAALRYADGAGLRAAFTACLAAGLIMLFRPTDCTVIGASLALFLLVATRHHPDRPPLGRLAAAVCCGFAFGPLLFAATHVATHGFTPGSYLEHSRDIGFEWRLLPMRWVTLMLNPKPLFPEGNGLAQIYWWVLPGMAGIAAAALADQGRRVRHLFVGGTAIAFTCVYLCYRDLHVPGLFGFNNQHYFKWVIPVFALYCAGLAPLLARRHVGAIAVGACLVMAVSCWRAQLAVSPIPSDAHVLPDGHGLALPNGLAPLRVAYLAASPKDFTGLYLGNHVIDQSGKTLHANADFKVFPVPQGFMLLPLRNLPAAPAELHLQAAVKMDVAAHVFVSKQEIVFGLPCAILHKRAVCQYRNFWELGQRGSEGKVGGIEPVPPNPPS